MPCVRKENRETVVAIIDLKVALLAKLELWTGVEVNYDLVSGVKRPVGNVPLDA